MAIRPILTHPDPALRAVCAPVTAFDATLAALVADMFDTMYAAPGRGLAAPQIGVLQRVFVTDTTWKDGARNPMVFVNPQLAAASLEEVVTEEGCLSIPDQSCFVTRPAEVTLRWQDVTGADRIGSYKGFAAACVQHETDHLDGILCIDHATGGAA